jgi:hypothetical protein
LLALHSYSLELSLEHSQACMKYPALASYPSLGHGVPLLSRAR